MSFEMAIKSNIYVLRLANCPQYMLIWDLLGLSGLWAVFVIAVAPSGEPAVFLEVLDNYLW